jgi:tripartite-type tricarboxylate transporter receptor subunit TctC
MLAGVKMHHVPYKGGGPALIDLLSGQVQVYFNTPISFIPHIRSGRLRILAVTGNTRLGALPQAPTFAEAGVPEFDIKTWIGVLAPPNTPREVIDKLSAEVARILATPDYREKLDNLGMAPLISTPDQFAALMRSETATLAKIIKTANIKIEQ